MEAPWLGAVCVFCDYRWRVLCFAEDPETCAFSCPRCARRLGVIDPDDEHPGTLEGEGVS